MNTMLAVMAGGALGSGLRYAVMLLAPGWLAILAVNYGGCWLAGFVYSATLPEMWRPAIQAGLLGGFTTFSAFSMEIIRQIHGQAPVMALAYAMASVLGGVLLAWLGMKAGQAWL